MKTTLVLATVTTPLPDGVGDFGFYRFSVSGQPDVDTTKPTAEFDLDAGSYSAKCQAYADDGAPLGNPDTLDFAVTGDAPAPATYEAPAGLSVLFG
jgi:hypothetical protein